MKASSSERGPGAGAAEAEGDVGNRGQRSASSRAKQVKPNGSLPPVLAAALDYATHGKGILACDGWHIFPCDTALKKSFKSAQYSAGAPWGRTKDAAQIKKDWRRWPNAGVGIPTGAINGFFVVEIDTKIGHGVDGAAALNALEVQYGALTLTLQAQSPSGSIHFYYKHPGNGIKIKNSAGELGQGIDVRGDGGMVVAPPSRRKDGTYTWLCDRAIADAPRWLLDLVIEKPRTDGKDHTAAPEVIAAAVAVIANPDLGWEAWNRIGMAIWAATQGSEAGRCLFDGFSQKSAKYNAKAVTDRWEEITKCPPDQIGVGTLYYLADQANPEWRKAVEGNISLDDFCAYLPMHSYLFTPTRELWPASSVNACIPPIPLLNKDGTSQLDKKGNPKYILASTLLDRQKPVHQMTWAPGRPMLIKNSLIAEGGWFPRKGATCFNLYRPPIIEPGDPTKVQPWLDLIKTIYPDDFKHILGFLAHRVQRPQDKINHALVLGGPPGIGKDSLLAPARYAIGPWNCLEVSPTQLLGRFNSFVKSVILRVSEARDLGDVNRYQLYDHMKIYCAEPPEVLRCDEKHLREHSIPNVCAPVITTNYKTDGIYLPADDRRHYVAWSDMTKEQFTKKYWDDLWGWYHREGFRNVAAYLASYSLADFDAKAPPKTTAAFWAIVDANRAPEDAELADVLDKIGNPKTTTLWEVAYHARGDFSEWIEDRKNRRNIPHRFEQCGYVPVRNDAASDGLFKIAGSRQVVYALAALNVRDRLKAVEELQKRLDDKDKPAQKNLFQQAKTAADEP